MVGKNPFDFANYQIGGAFANEGAEYLDGQPLNIGYINLPLMVPTQDAVSEFKVQYNNLGPEWGKFSGGVINISTKSGTNVWHGSAYEYLRNKVFNSNEYFLKGSQIAVRSQERATAVHAEPVRRNLRWTSDQGQDFLLLQLGRLSAAVRHGVYHYRAHRRRTKRRFFRACVTRQHLRSRRYSVDPGCATGADSPARTTRPFAGNVIPAASPFQSQHLTVLNPIYSPARPTRIRRAVEPSIISSRQRAPAGHVDEYVARSGPNHQRQQPHVRALCLLEAVEPGAGPIWHGLLQGSLRGEHS